MNNAVLGWILTGVFVLAAFLFLINVIRSMREPRIRRRKGESAKDFRRRKRALRQHRFHDKLF